MMNIDGAHFQKKVIAFWLDIILVIGLKNSNGGVPLR